jgi:hypothetical protein
VYCARVEQPHYPPHRNSFTLDDVSRLDPTVHEWRNSFVPINRVPLDVLSLIPIYLTSRGDLFRISSVCRYWRGTFIQRAALWPWLCLIRQRTDLYEKNLPGRSKGSAPDVIVEHDSTTMGLLCAEPLVLLSPHAQRIGGLNFVYNRWEDIQKPSEVASGPSRLASFTSLTDLALG